MSTPTMEVETAKMATTPQAGATKYVYFFGEGKADGNGKMKDELGGKGAGLAEMTNAGLPVRRALKRFPIAINVHSCRGSIAAHRHDDQPWKGARRAVRRHDANARPSHSDTVRGGADAGTGRAPCSEDA